MTSSMAIPVLTPSTDATFSFLPYDPTVSFISKYQLLINSNVPHPLSFDIIITIPPQITYINSYNGVQSSCIA